MTACDLNCQRFLQGKFLGLAAAFLLIVFTMVFYPNMVFQVQAGLEDATYRGLTMVSGEDPGIEDGLEFGDSDVEYMNRVFSERDHEVGYCGAVKSSGVVDVHMADTIEASESHLVFTWENCRLDLVPDSHRVMIHTHPGGSNELSGVDKETFAGSDFEYSCIQYSNIRERSDGSVSGLNCFGKESDSGSEFGYSFPSVGVELTE